MRNSAFPAATSNDGNRNISFDSAAVTAFAATLAAARANGWVITPAALATAPLARIATIPLGKYYVPALSDPLFDIAP
jgi:hypothetical protein